MQSQTAVKRPVIPTAGEIENLVIDPANSSIGFSVGHLGISHIRGRFIRFSGSMIYDRLDISRSSVDIVIDTTSVDTDHSGRDSELRSWNFLDTRSFPRIVFKSRWIEPQCEGYLCGGELTVHGITKEVEIPFEILGRQKDAEGKDRIGFEAEVTLDRREFGLTYNARLENGGLVVGNEVKIQLSIEAVRE